MNYPKISIVTPNFNGAEYLEETIKSVLSQNYPNLEYIIIDGGSTDSSVDIIKKYESQLVYWISEPDKGLYDAIQKGFDKSSGEIMAWINSDDLYHPKAFFTVAEIFNLEGVNWLQGIPSIFDQKGRTVAVNKIKRWSKLDYYLGNFKWIQQESVFWRRSLWEVSGAKLATDMKYASDLELWLRFFRYEKLFVTGALLAGFRMRSKEQLSLNFHNEYLEEARSKIKWEVENNIPENERNLVKKIKRHNNLVKKIHFSFLKRIIDVIFYAMISKKKELYFSCPRVISFDRIKQEFKFDSNV
ncbi:glycosyltransferase family 2 protein [Flavobacterium defluvii]|uniref:Glycosyltransferase involved in cell wall bisynthesis n=1 Tax=Flavobacterium defluvii TaxID=370979 RepID=A0A1M5NU85_9FLAO|nr:glycosyltransferase family 2 protein [Flavobacterium defluvii]SHG93121.1 Glycosyltransferase involved in cell wall bisynthesis [Flavobacterium defluvii]